MTARSQAAFAAGTSVAAVNISTPTTVPSSDLITPGPAAPVAQRVILVAASTADPPPVRFPPWWSGNCDANNYPGSFPLSSWDGLTACGPGVHRGGWDRTVAFFSHAWGEYEWECVELSMRWLYLEYGVRPYPANGSEVVDYYSAADGGDLQKMANDGSSVPAPGDVLSMEPTWEEGHTAVVTATNVTDGTGTIDILEQNMDGGNGTNTLGVSRRRRRTRLRHAGDRLASRTGNHRLCHPRSGYGGSCQRRRFRRPRRPRTGRRAIPDSRWSRPASCSPVPPSPAAMSTRTFRCPSARVRVSAPPPRSSRQANARGARCDGPRVSRPVLARNVVGGLRAARGQEPMDPGLDLPHRDPGALGRPDSVLRRPEGVPARR